MIDREDLDMMGKTVKDKVTGYTGIVTQLAENFTGFVQAAVRPKVVESGTLPDALFIDTHQLEVVDAGVSESLPFPMVCPDVSLGDVYKDELTGKEGIAVWLTLHINGCHTVTIKPKVKDEDKEVHVDASVKTIKKINKKGVREMVFPPAAVTTEKPKRPSGGPMRSVPNRRIC